MAAAATAASAGRAESAAAAPAVGCERRQASVADPIDDSHGGEAGSEELAMVKQHQQSRDYRIKITDGRLLIDVVIVTTEAKQWEV